MAVMAEDWHLGAGEWYNTQSVEAITWHRGYCGNKVSSKTGYYATSSTSGQGQRLSHIRICPSRHGPTAFIKRGKHSPSYPPGDPVPNTPDELGRLYMEARLSAGAGAYTAAVLVCRKMLMNIGVAEGAKENLSFIKYVEYLADNGFVPPKG